MPNVRASSGMIGTNRAPISLSFIRSLSSRTKAIVVATGCLPEPVAQLGVGLVARQRRSGLARTTRLGSAAAERGPALLHVLDLVGVLARVVVRRQVRVQRVVRDRQVEPVAERLELGVR